MSTIDDDDRSKQNHLVRALEPDFMAKHNIEPPVVALHNCAPCSHGHVYKGPQDAVTHLKRVHFRYNSSLSQLAHLQTTYHYWIRSEHEVRNEIANSQYLHLLQICLKYLKILFARAEKIHMGITHEKQTDIASYQLAKDLVDCFEATALFIMQSATSILAIESEMRQWQHVSGSAFDRATTPAIQYALERLGELGQAAQSSMTRAEKTLALFDPETTSVGRGFAGPELLALVICQNLRNKQLLDGNGSDVNRLYQESTSKLVCFTRTRLCSSVQFNFFSAQYG